MSKKNRYDDGYTLGRNELVKLLKEAGKLKLDIRINPYKKICFKPTGLPDKQREFVKNNRGFLTSYFRFILGQITYYPDWPFILTLSPLKGARKGVEIKITKISLLGSEQVFRYTEIEQPHQFLLKRIL